MSGPKQDRERDRRCGSIDIKALDLDRLLV
jgi:hypothetical protein